MGLKIDRRISLIPKIIGWIVVAILLVLIVKLLIWENSYYKEKSAQSRAEVTPVLTMVEHVIAPGETPLTPEEYANYQTEADMPRYLKIERLGVNTIVCESEMSKDILPMPDNIHQAIWYAGSARPGQGRNVIISGISSGNSDDGIFKNLASLETGDAIIIENGNNFEYTYEVAEIRIIEESNMNLELNVVQKQIDDTETLSLVTTNADNRGDYTSVAFVRATLVRSTELEQ